MIAFLRSLFLVSAIAVLAVAPARAQDDPLLQGRVAEALFFNGQLWLRAALVDVKNGGGLVSIDLATGARTEHMDRGVIDMEISQGKLWVLRQATDAARVFIVFEWRDGALAPAANLPVKSPHPIAFAVTARNFIVLSAVSLHTFDRAQSRWQPITLRGKLPFGATFAVAKPTGEDALYFGANNGVNGGGLRRIDINTGGVAAIEKNPNTNPCQGPLATACTPVTSVIPDPLNPRCVIAAIGLGEPDVMDGRVMRVCGTEVTVLFEEKLAVQPDDAHVVNYEPIFGLAPASDGFWAVGRKRVFRFRGDSQTSAPIPSPAPVAGTRMGRGDGVAVIPTAAGPAIAVSGYGAVVVATGP